jgi:hypothetical protein
VFVLLDCDRCGHHRRVSPVCPAVSHSPASYCNLACLISCDMLDASLCALPGICAVIISVWFALVSLRGIIKRGDQSIASAASMSRSNSASMPLILMQSCCWWVLLLPVCVCVSVRFASYGLMNYCYFI